MSCDVFISYASIEKEYAVRVKEVIEANGFSCWMAPESIPGGSSYANEIDSAISNCKVTVLILSEKSQKSIWVPKEISSALTCGKTVVPFHIDESVIYKPFTFYLTDAQRIEAYQNISIAYSQLVSVLHSIIERTDKSTEPKMTNTSNKTNEFLDLLNTVYKNMITYRETVRKGEVQRINEESGNLQDSMQRIYLFYEFNQFSNVEKASKAKQVVDHFNLFIDYYGKFISFPIGESRMSVSAQQFAKKAEEVFNSTLTMIVRFISEQSEK